jgi:uncharacterized protein (DUF2344 family)
VKFTQGFHPLPKIAFGPGMPVGKEMSDQLFTIDFETYLGEKEILEKLNRELPEGIVITQVNAAATTRSAAPLPPSPAIFPSL